MSCYLKKIHFVAFLLLLVLAIVAKTTSANTFEKSARTVGKRVADYQLEELGYSEGLASLPRPTSKPKSTSTSWEIAAFWIGLSQFADVTQDPRYKKALVQQAENNQWKLGPWLEFADDHAIGQSYLWAARNGVAKKTALGPMRQSFDKILANPPKVHLSFYFGEEGYGSAECLKRWCWCDALFMAPPSLIGLAQATGDKRYEDFALKEFWATTDFLFDPVENLYFRDSRFFESRDDKKRKLFWSRGNGWVFAGIANILKLLPENHPERARMVRLFQNMARRLLELQKPDGYWSSSLLAPEGSPPESSGTGFFTFGLAYGINAGILPKAQYSPAAALGWQALVNSVDKSGRLGWVQQVSDKPNLVKKSDSHYYGTGAFLLAASEMVLVKP